MTSAQSEQLKDILLTKRISL